MYTPSNLQGLTNILANIFPWEVGEEWRGEGIYMSSNYTVQNPNKSN